ncbi:MAG: site-specific DNA-methyltransferase [Pseudolysinimonas sp.]
MSDALALDAKEASKLTKEEWREWTTTMWSIANNSHGEHPAVFPREIPHRLVKMFSFFGETVLDPFAGTGTTAVAANAVGRDAVLYEQNARFAEIASTAVGSSEGSGTTRVITGDSRDMSALEDGSVDLIVTSPPYWDKAEYGGGESDLGAIESYYRFLEEMVEVWAECLRVLRPGRKLCIVTANVSQHTNHGLLMFPLAADFLAGTRSVGFLPVAEIIWNKHGTGGKWGSGGAQRPIFGSYPYPPNFLFKTVHEHIIVLSKPGLGKTTGPKVRSYERLTSPLELAE